MNPEVKISALPRLDPHRAVGPGGSLPGRLVRGGFEQGRGERMGDLGPAGSGGLQGPSPRQRRRRGVVNPRRALIKRAVVLRTDPRPSRRISTRPTPGSAQDPGRERRWWCYAKTRPPARPNYLGTVCTTGLNPIPPPFPTIIRRMATAGWLPQLTGRPAPAKPEHRPFLCILPPRAPAAAPVGRD